MLSLQSPHKLVIIFIAILITQFSVTQASDSTARNSTVSVQCMGGFSSNPVTQNATCLDKDDQRWVCPRAQCGKDGHLYVSMKGCFHNGDLRSGASNQQCAQYNNQPNSFYACQNPGGEVYLCPYNATEGQPPYITCADCVKSEDQVAPSGGPGRR
ncbi:uncharacterized protein MELLADRAFT_123588 [Melampsora larici-populina 98AG31]|uniref:Secreted protein n=1 Tax=Melampsora larici-populina (strain 98AG31 / pathotype 3-4-7) TaxID=747676 RepID=F4RXS8_MELLP|nr:uncharacterized protein MELLADRAFT_123588 [Melampsora larici-populina 98AG31]EGG02781.1 secreted protein [Melampsora larici-populina 98AG31]